MLSMPHPFASRLQCWAERGSCGVLVGDQLEEGGARVCSVVQCNILYWFVVRKIQVLHSAVLHWERKLWYMVWLCVSWGPVRRRWRVCSVAQCNMVVTEIQVLGTEQCCSERGICIMSVGGSVRLRRWMLCSVCYSRLYRLCYARIRMIT